MTLGTVCDRHVGLQSLKRCGFGDVDVTLGAFVNVLFLLTTTFVHELDRDPRRIGDWQVWRRELVTAVAVVGDRLLGLPMTVETGRMVRWGGFEGSGARRVADGTVVIALLCV